MLLTFPCTSTLCALAPTGRMRASINLGNPILAKRSADGASAEGVSVDLARELARWLALPLELVIVESAGQSVANVDAGHADFGFVAVDPARATTLQFTAPYLLIQGAYLVRASSPLVCASEVDRANTRVCVGKGSAYDLYLSRALGQAQIVRAETSPTVVDTFLRENLEVAAGVRQQLEYDQQRHATALRLLPEDFMTIGQAMACQRQRGLDAAKLLSCFIEEQKRNGFVAQALLRHSIQGASVAPLSVPAHA